jgi:hypothetical protein
MLCGDDTEIMRKHQGFYRTMRKTEDWTQKLWKIKDFINMCEEKLRNDPKCWAILASRWPRKLSTAQHPQILSQALAAQD